MKDQKDKWCSFIFTAAFAHIYQECQYHWAALYVSARFGLVYIVEMHTDSFAKCLVLYIFLLDKVARIYFF